MPIMPIMQSPFQQNQHMPNNQDQQHSPSSPTHQALLASPRRSQRSVNRSNRTHPYNTSTSPLRRHLNSSPNRSQNDLPNGDFSPPAQPFATPSQISNSYQSTPQLPWPSGQTINSNHNPSTMQNVLNQNLPQHTSSQHNSFNIANQALPASSVPNGQNPPPQQSDSSNTGFFGILGKIWPFKS